MNKIKVIDLLNMISKGEEVPKKIKYQNYIYEYQHRRDTESSFNYMCNENGEYLSRRYFIDNILNDEVEIIEENAKEPQEHKIPEKLTKTTLYGVPILNKKELSNITLTNKRDIVYIKDKINEIIDYLEEIK